MNRQLREVLSKVWPYLYHPDTNPTGGDSRICYALEVAKYEGVITGDECRAASKCVQASIRPCVFLLEYAISHGILPPHTDVLSDEYVTYRNQWLHNLIEKCPP